MQQAQESMLQNSDRRISYEINAAKTEKLQQQSHKQNRKRIQKSKVNRKQILRLKANRKEKETKKGKDKAKPKMNGRRIESSRPFRQTAFSGCACCCQRFVFRNLVRKRGEENKEERRNEGIDQKGETRYNGIQYERNQLEEAKHNGTQYERNQQEEAKHNGTQYERSQQEEAPNESTASGGFSESLLRLNMDAIGIRNEPTVKAILALARRRKLGGPCGTLWKVLSSEYRSTLLKKNEPGDYILWALNHSAEFEDTYNGILKKRVRGR